MLFEARLNGLKDPGDAVNQSMGFGDLREAVWFGPFDNRSIWDSRRGFRR